MQYYKQVQTGRLENLNKETLFADNLRFKKKLQDKQHGESIMSHVNANLQVSVDTLIATVKDVVENRKMVAAVYLLSSHRGDKIKKGVELNLAFLMNRFFYKRDRRESYAQTLFAESEIKNRLGISVNIILLNSSPIVSIYHMITTGKCIFEQYRSERISYEVAAKSQYYDLHPFVAEHHTA